MAAYHGDGRLSVRPGHVRTGKYGVLMDCFHPAWIGQGLTNPVTYHPSGCRSVPPRWVSGLRYGPAVNRSSSASLQTRAILLHLPGETAADGIDDEKSIFFPRLNGGQVIVAMDGLFFDPTRNQ